LLTQTSTEEKWQIDLRRRVFGGGGRGVQDVAATAKSDACLYLLL